MADYLNELALKSDIQTYVTEKMSTDLIQMIHGKNSLTGRAASKALVLISSYAPNIKTLIDVGIIQLMTEKMFTWKIAHKSKNAEEDFVTILVNILHSGVDPESIQVNRHGHTMASEYFICNIISMLKNSVSYELNINLINILTWLSNIQKLVSRVKSVIKETKAIQTITEFLNSEHDELTIASTELLIKLTSHMGHAIAEELCKIRGQPESLIGILDSNQIHIDRKKAVCLNLLAKLPHENLTVNLALLHNGTVPAILERIKKIQRGEAMVSSWTRVYLEGLVGTLVRFTSTIHEPDILHMARQQNLSSVLTGLVQMNAGSEEVQRLALLGLEKLSSESINLTIKHPETTKTRKGIRNFNFNCFCMREKAGRYGRVEVHICPVHRGECSSNTFCLLEAKAVQGLVSSLESENDGVVETAMAAISTLLDDRVDLERSVAVLCEADALKRVMGVLRDRQEGRVWEKTLWVIERFLEGGAERSATEISGERILPKALVGAFHHGDGRIRAVAERITRKLNQMPASQRVL
ncbi:putative U-box domain-containing protein 42 [Platanthera zijinensis]|uniref:U-box domain-containing protein 42 n=1 Tax=Platanthera zijinensis TaxID=2320716 RepID=A0AAP0GBR5_9ASPA